MLKITMTSPLFKGALIFNYSDAGQLCRLDIQAELNDKQRAFLDNNIPWDEQAAQDFMDRLPQATFVVQDKEITFDMFWDRYDDKARSSLKKTRAKWDKMKLEDQVRAYLFIPKYLRNKGTADKKYATTYLNDELWNN